MAHATFGALALTVGGARLAPETLLPIGDMADERKAS